MAHLSYFDYRNVPFDLSALCVRNQLHAFLYNRGLNGNAPALVTFNNRPKVVWAADVSELGVEKTPLDTLMGRAEAQILSERGMHISSHDFSGKLREALVSSYLLNSCVCVTNVNTQQHGIQYSMITKSPEIVAALQPRFAPSDKRKGMERFNEQFA